MSALWQALKNTLHCKSRPSDVHEPNPRILNRNRIRSRSPSRARSSCCKPKSNGSSNNCKSGAKDVINNQRKRFQKKHTIASPLSIRSNDLINPVIHQVRLNNLEFNIMKYQNGLDLGSASVMAAGSPGSGISSFLVNRPDPFSRTASGSRLNLSPGPSTHRRFVSVDSGVGGFIRPSACHKCGKPLTRHDAEEHYLSEHAVSEVLEGDSSRKVIEMIVKAGWRNELNKVHMERILKVQNPQTKLAVFEEYRETVKIKAHRLQHSKKHPRCLADGNELLRFHGTTLACPLGQNGSSILCTMQRCNVCCILRHGFSTKGETKDGCLGIFTTSTSERAYTSIDVGNDVRQNHDNTLKKALVVCRVIAGRVHKPLGGNSQELSGGGSSMFDSIAGEMGVDNSHFEELYLLNPIALLPCFVIVCK